jgi:hypothetical protein
MNKTLATVGSNEEENFSTVAGKSVASVGLGALALAALPWIDTPHAAVVAVVGGAALWVKGKLSG